MFKIFKCKHTTTRKKYIYIERDNSDLQQVPPHPFIFSYDQSEFFSDKTKKEYPQRWVLPWKNMSFLFKIQSDVPQTKIKLIAAEVALALQHLLDNGIFIRKLDSCLCMDEQGHIVIIEWQECSYQAKLLREIASPEFLMGESATGLPPGSHMDAGCTV